jgi:hypothetical protein
MPKRKESKHFSARTSLDNVSLAKAGSAMRLVLVAKGEKLGELQVGRGSLFWWGANRKIRKRVHWRKFAELMNEVAYGEK